MEHIDQDEIVMLTWTDYVGLARTRAVPFAHLTGKTEYGQGWPMAGQSLNAFDENAPNPWGPAGEVRQIPDMSTHTRLQLQEDTPPFHLVLCDSVQENGQQWSCCARTFAKKALEDLKIEFGLIVSATVEQEFSVYSPSFEPGPAFTVKALRQNAGFAQELCSALMNSGLEPEAVEPEFGPGQIEYSLAPANGITAADRAVIARELVHEIARIHGLDATLSPKPELDRVGSGMHLHFSFWTEDGRNVLYDESCEGAVSAIGGHAAAGIINHMRALCALTTPSVVSYLRLGPRNWSAAYTAFGIQNRETSLRVCPSPQRDPVRKENAYNFEFRACDATSNPYLVLGAIVRAALEGLRAKGPTPHFVHGDPSAMSMEEREKCKIFCLPVSLGEALDCLEKDKTVSGWLGDEFLGSYLQLKRQEAARISDISDEQICQLYRSVY